MKFFYYESKYKIKKNKIFYYVSKFKILFFSVRWRGDGGGGGLE